MNSQVFIQWGFHRSEGRGKVQKLKTLKITLKAKESNLSISKDLSRAPQPKCFTYFGGPRMILFGFYKEFFSCFYTFFAVILASYIKCQRYNMETTKTQQSKPKYIFNSGIECILRQGKPTYRVYFGLSLAARLTLLAPFFPRKKALNL